VQRRGRKRMARGGPSERRGEGGTRGEGQTTRKPKPNKQHAKTKHRPDTRQHKPTTDQDETEGKANKEGRRQRRGGDRPVQESFGPRWSQNGASHAKCNASTDSTLNHRVWNPSQLSVPRIHCRAKAARRRPLTSPTVSACGSASTKPRPRLGGLT